MPAEPARHPSASPHAPWPEDPTAWWPEAADAIDGPRGDATTNGSANPRVHGRPTGRRALPSPSWTSGADAGRRAHARGAFRTNGWGMPPPGTSGDLGPHPPPGWSQQAPEPPASPLAWVDQPVAPGTPDLDASWPNLPGAAWEPAATTGDGPIWAGTLPGGYPPDPGSPPGGLPPAPSWNDADPSEAGIPPAAWPWTDPEAPHRLPDAGPAAWPGAAPAAVAPLPPDPAAAAALPPEEFWAPRPAPRQPPATPAPQWQAPPVSWAVEAAPVPPAGPSAYPGGAVRPRPRRPGTGETQLTETRVERYGDGYGRRGRRQPRAAFVAELPVLVIAAVILAILVKGFLVQAFYIPSRSMEPTLEVGDRVVVNRLSYRLGAPQRGQVVVFLRPTGERVTAPSNALSWVRQAVAQGLGSAPPGNEDLIKRIIAGPGDVVQGSHGRVWLNRRALIEPYLRPGTRTSDFGPVRVPPGYYWVMGDNREDSSDSRVFGPVPRSTLVGRATGKVWPVPRFGLL